MSYQVIKRHRGTGRQWRTPLILATHEAEIRKIVVRSQPRQIVHKSLSRERSSQKRAGGVAQGVGPEFKPQYHKKRKENGGNLNEYYNVNEANTI
jgi:hypothetical protein